MNLAELTFEYGDQPDSMFESEDFLLRIPAAIRSKADLLAAFADSGHFPEYFGFNWDALLDCLRDLSWIANRRVVILHDDLPLHEDRVECCTYLEILHLALTDWAAAGRPATTESPPEWPYVDHELRVVFPTWVSPEVARAVAATA